MLDSIDYWNKRAAKSFYYKGERLYTITPPPFYIHRRKKVINLLRDFISGHKEINRICDFGCGDGYYSVFLADSFIEKKIFGYDKSQMMICRAINDSKRRENLVFTCCAENIKINDLICVFAVLAHVSDAGIPDLIKLLKNKLVENGLVCLFESTNKVSQIGKNWRRRTIAEYIRFFDDSGFELVYKKTLSYPVFDWLKKKILDNIRIKYFNNDPLQANLSKYYLLLSQVILIVSIPLNCFFRSRAGNTFFIFRAR